jgi:acetylornithine/N-succinyldiaminopimelate aminotransferase
LDHILRCHEIIKTDFTSGQNCYLYDSGGNKYIDFESGTWAAGLGHNHPRVNQKMEMQLKQITHLGTRYPSFLAEAAATDILDIVGMASDGKCVFLSSGSEAVEFGVQAIRRITGKSLLLTFQNSFLASYGSAGRKESDEWSLLDWSTCDDIAPFACLDKIPFERIGGFAFEPGGSGIGFVHFPPGNLVREIVRRVRQAGGLILANEITTGMGRTGKWFGFQHYGIQPDIVAIGKGLGNGYPVSAVAMQPRVAEKLEAGGFHYAQSHQNDPLGCTVAREVIAVLREEHWIERGDQIGTYFLEGLKQLGGKYALIKEARGRGMLLALEFHPNDVFSVSWAYRALLENGYLVGYYPPGNILRFDPSLTIPKEDISLLLEDLDGLLVNAEKVAIRKL